MAESLTPEEHIAKADAAYAAAQDIKSTMDARERDEGHIAGKASPWYLAREHDFLTLTQIASLHASMAAAKALVQMPICDHGNRGWCEPCYILQADRRQQFVTMTGRR